MEDYLVSCEVCSNLFVVEIENYDKTMNVEPNLVYCPICQRKTDVDVLQKLVNDEDEKL